MKDVDRVIAVLREMRSHFGRDVSLSTAMAFLTIAREPGISSSELFRRLEISPLNASRVTTHLSETHRGGLPGLGLIEAVVDPGDQRRRRFRLSRQGELVWARVKKTIED